MNITQGLATNPGFFHLEPMGKTAMARALLELIAYGLRVLLSLLPPPPGYKALLGKPPPP